MGKCFSPEIYEGVFKYNITSSVKYTLKMKNINGIVLTRFIKEVRQENPHFLSSNELKEILQQILQSLINGYNRCKSVRSHHQLTRNFLWSYFTNIIKKMRKYNVLSYLKIKSKLSHIQKCFRKYLDLFFTPPVPPDLPINHGDLSTNNIVITQDQKKVYLIDPYPEILNTLKFKNNIPNPKCFSYYSDLAHLKLSISSFQNFSEKYTTFNKVLIKYPFFHLDSESIENLLIWELLVTLRQIIILFFNFKQVTSKEGNDLENNLHYSLFQRYGIKLKRLTS